MYMYKSKAHMAKFVCKRERMPESPAVQLIPQDKGSSRGHGVALTGAEWASVTRECAWHSGIS